MHTEEGYRDSQVRDRPFDPSKVPASPELWALVEEVDGMVTREEARVRRRKPAAQAIYRDSISALVADLVHRQTDKPDAWLTIEMSKKALGTKTRRAPFMTESLPALVRHMEAAGALELDLGYRNQFGSVRTRVRASSGLVGRMGDLGLGFEDVGRNPALLGDPIVLKGEKSDSDAPRLSLPDTEQVRLFRAEMTAINEWIASASLGWEEDESEVPVDPGKRFLRRVFNQARFDRGGRLYGGFWQAPSSDRRLRCLRINSERVASVDFASMAVQLAYADVGATPPEGDLYAHPWYPRAGVKLVLNAALSASAPFRRMPDGARQYFRRRTSVGDVVAELERRHPAIRSMFFSSSATKLMHLESQITVRALIALKDRGVVALPLHDSLMVPRTALQAAKEELGKASLEVVGVDIPVSVSISLES